VGPGAGARVWCRNARGWAGGRGAGEARRRARQVRRKNSLPSSPETREGFIVSKECARVSSSLSELLLLDLFLALQNIRIFVYFHVCNGRA
jgi:hypothetical protein